MQCVSREQFEPGLRVDLSPSESVRISETIQWADVSLVAQDGFGIAIHSFERHDFDECVARQRHNGRLPGGLDGCASYVCRFGERAELQIGDEFSCRLFRADERVGVLRMRRIASIAIRRMNPGAWTCRTCLHIVVAKRLIHKVGVEFVEVERGLSQEAFADLVGVHRTYMGGLERGERNLTLKSLERIAAKLTVRPLDLLR